MSLKSNKLQEISSLNNTITVATPLIDNNAQQPQNAEMWYYEVLRLTQVVEQQNARILELESLVNSKDKCIEEQAAFIREDAFVKSFFNEDDIGPIKKMLTYTPKGSSTSNAFVVNTFV